MVQMIVDLGDKENMVLNVVKGKYVFKNKSDAMNFIIVEYEQENLEPELRPEFVEKIKRIEKHGKFKKYSSVKALRKAIENE